jgi:hypothetical protein
MALVNCPECAREVSDKAKACPHCGAPVSAAPVLIEQTGKRLKLYQGIGCGGMMISLFGFFAIMTIEDAPNKFPPIAFIAFPALFILFFASSVIASILKWWRHS